MLRTHASRRQVNMPNDMLQLQQVTKFVNGAGFLFFFKHSNQIRLSLCYHCFAPRTSCCNRAERSKGRRATTATLKLVNQKLCMFDNHLLLTSN